MPISYVQSAQIYSSSSLSLNGVAAGNLLVACITGYSTTEDTTVSDDRGGSWTGLTARGPMSGGPAYGRIFYCQNHPGGNVTVSLSNPPSGCGWVLLEYSGVDTSAAFDEENYKDNTTYDTTFESNSVTVASGALMVVCLVDETIDSSVTWDTGWNERQEDLSSAYSVSDRIVSSAGTYEATGVRGTNSNSELVMIAAFNEAAVAAQQFLFNQRRAQRAALRR